MFYSVMQFYSYQLECCNVFLCRYSLPSTVGGLVVVIAIVVVSSILVVTNVAEYSCEYHRGNQDGVGDGEY